MAKTIRSYTSDGAQVLYPIDFVNGFIKREYVYVYLDTDAYTTQIAYTWVNDSQIQLTAPVANTLQFHIRRVVPRDTKVNDYNDGSIFKESNIDDSYDQSLMILEEVEDGYVTGPLTPIEELIQQGQGASFTQEDAPADPVIAGVRWYKPSEATTYVWYIDDTSSQWVEENPSEANAPDRIIPQTKATWENSAGVTVGQIVQLEDRANGLFKVIAGTGSANTLDILAHSTLDFSLQLLINETFEINNLGPVADGATDELVLFNRASTLGKVKISTGNYSVSATPSNLQNFHGDGIVTNSATGSKIFTGNNFYHLVSVKGTPTDLENANTTLGAHVIVNHEDSDGPALDILNAGDRAAGNSAQSSIVVHHYNDGVPVQVDNVGINTGIISKQARNSTRRSDEASDFVGYGPFFGCVRAGDGSADPHTGVAQNVFRINSLGDIQFDKDTSHRNAARTIHALGSMVVSDEVLDTGDGGTVAFGGTLDQKPIETTTLVITDGVETFTDAGSMVLAGDAGGTGTINYTTGVWAVTFNTAPLNLQDITASYEYGQSLRISTETGNLFLKANSSGRKENYSIICENPIALAGVDELTPSAANPGSNLAMAKSNTRALPIFWAGTRWKTYAVMDQGTGAHAGGLLAAGAQIDKTIACTGAGYGQVAMGSYDKDLQGCTISANPAGANAVQVVIYNGTGSGVTLAAGTVSAVSFKI